MAELKVELWADLKAEALVEHSADSKVDCWVEPMAVRLVEVKAGQ